MNTTSLRKLLALLLFPLFTIAVAGAAPSHTSGASGKSVSNTSHQGVGDAQLESTIRTKLQKSKIGKDGFRFHVQRGVVTWEGTTAIGQHKGAATRMARTSGAVQVINNIRVSSTGKETPLRKAYVQP